MLLFRIICLSLFVGINAIQAQVYRWSVKTLTDTAGQRIYHINPIQDSISGLADTIVNPRPSKNQLNKGKRANAEKIKVTFTAYVLATGMEDDGDYHLVMEDLRDTKTLIAEIPNPESENLLDFKNLKQDFSHARNEIDTKIGKPSSTVKALHKKVKVRVTGFIFFDKMAHGKGHALNGIEIHPVLEIEVLE